MTEVTEERYLAPSDAARRLSISTITLRKWGASGKVASRRAGGGHHEYLEADIERLRESEGRDLLVSVPERLEADELLAPGEVAAMFRVDPKTVGRWAEAGKLHPVFTPGGQRRYREPEVRALFQAGRGGGRP